jgi:hypothetical protein
MARTSGCSWSCFASLPYGSGATLRRRLAAWSSTGVLHQVHARLLRMVRGGPHEISAPSDAVVDSCSVRAKRGGDLVGPNPTDRGKPGTKYHVAVDADGLPLAAVASAANQRAFRSYGACSGRDD